MSKLRHAKHARVPAMAMALFFSAVMAYTSPDQVWVGMNDVLNPNQAHQAYDLAFSKFEVKKIAEPGGKSTETVYEVKTTVRNDGLQFKNEQVIFNIHPVGVKMVLAQKDGNFSLKTGETHEVSARISLPFFIAEQPLHVSLEAFSFEDPDPENAYEEYVAKTDRAGLHNISIKSVNRDGTVKLGWNLPSPRVGAYKFSLLQYQSDKSFNNTETSHKGVDGTYYSYEQGGFSHELINKYSFSEKEISVTEKTFDIGDDLYDSKLYRMLIVKAENAETGGKIYSDPIYLSPQNLMDRASLARMLVEKLKLSADKNVIVFYKDIEDGAWYAPFVKALYAAGFTNGDAYFRPHDIATRADIAEIMTLAFDLPLGGEVSYYEDVKEDHPAFYAIHALKKSIVELNNRAKFAPQEPATVQFIDFVIKSLDQLR